MGHRWRLPEFDLSADHVPTSHGQNAGGRQRPPAEPVDFIVQAWRRFSCLGSAGPRIMNITTVMDGWSWYRFRRIIDAGRLIGSWRGRWSTASSFRWI